MPHYKIKGIPGLEGLVVEAEYRSVGDVLCILQIINPNAVIGDRTVHYPIPESKLYIDDSMVEECLDPGIQQFSSKSPFGKLLFEGRLNKDQLVVDYVQYDNAVSVTIREKQRIDGTGGSETHGWKTIYTQNFFKGKAGVAMQTVAHAFGGELDVEDLVFDLKEIHARKE